MGVASVVYNGIRIPLNSQTPRLRSSSQVRITNSAGVRFIDNHSTPRLFIVDNSRSFQYLPLLCSKGTDQEDDLSLSEYKRISAQQNAKTDGGKISHNHLSISNNDESQGHADYASSIRTVALCVSTAVTFGLGLAFKDGVGKASEFFAGYILEQSLSVDNLFVFVLIFKYFKVPAIYQNRVLSYGIAGAIVFRLTLILLGTVTIQRFEAVNLLLAGILLYSSFKLLSSEDDDTDLSDNIVVRTCQKFIPVTDYYDGNRFLTNKDGVWKATPLLLTVAVIELSDIAFAVDSIPAVFGVTRDPFIVFTSNLFAILGLRSLFTLISEGLSDLEYLQPSIAVVLGFIGCKMVLEYFGLDGDITWFRSNESNHWGGSKSGQEV